MRTSRFLLAGLLVGLGAALASGSASGQSVPATPAPSPLSIEERAYVASRLYLAVNTHFAHWEGAEGVDWDAAYRAYLSAALSAPDRRAFALESQAFLAQLRNGHTIFVDRAQMSMPEGERIGFILQHVEGQWVVASSEIPELRSGDVVVAMGDTPFETFYQEVRRYLPASTEAWARRVLFEDIPGFYSGGLYFPLRFTLSLGDGREVLVDRQALPPRGPAPTTEGRWLEEGRVAYVRVPSFKEPRFEDEAVSLVDQFMGAEVIIVDVRGNTGGSTPTRLHEVLMDRPYRWWAGSTHMAPALHQSHAESGNGWYGDFRRPHLAWPARTLQLGKSPFQGRVLVLTDAVCNSACEDFAMPFKDNGRAILIGETTAGSTGQPHVLDLGSGMVAIIGTKRERFPDGSVFEGVGVQPDVVAVPQISDLRDGRDAALEQALRVAAERR